MNIFVQHIVHVTLLNQYSEPQISLEIRILNELVLSTGHKENK